MTPDLIVPVEHCPLCGGSRHVAHSLPTPNLYSEKLAELLDEEESRLLEHHANWQCGDCGLVYKRRWFSASALAALFRGAVARHPRGWDAVLGRFSADNFLNTLEHWAGAIAASRTPDIRRGERELLSILDSIVPPSGFVPADAVAAIRERRVAHLRDMAPAIASSMTAPAPFKRFSGFTSAALWDYLQSRAGHLEHYAELGCPLWGQLSLAASRHTRATFLMRDEPNYWADTCSHGERHCLSRLLDDRRIASAPWSAQARYSMIGLFQYLDHLREPGVFLKELFERTDSAAIILDGMEAPLAIQHITGWSDTCFARVAATFGKHLHLDFDAIRPSGNRLYLLADQA